MTASEFIEQRQVAIGKCRSNHRHGYGCNRDGYLLNLPCKICGDSEWCEYCRRMLEELELVERLENTIEKYRVNNAIK